MERLSQLAEGADDAAAQARRRLLDSVHVLGTRGKLEKAIDLLGEFSPRNDEERIHIIEVCRRLQRLNKIPISQEHKRQLDVIETRTYESTFFGRLRRWVGKRPFTDYDSETGKGFQRADEMVHNLAGEAIGKDLSDSEIAWVASREAEYAWLFGYSLGQLDPETRFLSKIVAGSSDDGNELFLAGYLADLGQTLGEEKREDILDDLTGTRPQLAFDCTWRNNPTHRGYQRLTELVDSGRVNSEKLQILIYGQWMGFLSSKEVATVIQYMLQGDVPKVHEPAMHMLNSVLGKHPESIDQIEPLVWKLLELRPSTSKTMTEWEWGELAKKMAARSPGRMVATVLRLFQSEDFVPLKRET